MHRSFVALSLALAATGCGTSPDCSSELVHKAVEPAGDRYAVVEVRGCGATTGLATVVRVGHAGQSPDAATEVFVADDNDGKARIGRAGNIWMSVVWPRPGELSVAYASGARVFRRVPSAEGAKITYIATGPIVLPGVP